MVGEGQRQPVHVVVHKVELAGAAQRVGDVHRLPHSSVQARITGVSARAHAVERRRGGRIQGGEQRHVDTAGHEALGEETVTCSQGP
jgi:hypothetical protein